MLKKYSDSIIRFDSNGGCGVVRAMECESNRGGNLHELSSGSEMQWRRTVSSLGDYPSGVPGMESWRRGFAWQSAVAAVKRFKYEK